MSTFRVDSVDVLSEPLEMLPPLEFAFAYGSAVFPQHSGRSQDVPQTDYIVAVESPAEWHAENLASNPGHYAPWLRRMGGATISALAQRVGVGVHFNTMVPWQDRMIKYGVIGQARLEADLRQWESLYVSGRMHKPVRILHPNHTIEEANQVNLRSALAAALLLMPEEVGEMELFRCICQVSYRGDIRMLFAEDPYKVDKIVDNSFQNLRSLYSIPIQQRVDSGQLAVAAGGAGWTQELSRVAQHELLTILPPKVVGGDAQKMARKPRADMQLAIRSAMATIVRRASARQALSGVVAAGGMNAARYVGRKVCKWWTARR